MLDLISGMFQVIADYAKSDQAAFIREVQETLAAEIATLEKAVSSYDQGKKSAEKFIALIDKYQGFENMTNTMLNEFVEKILVHERDRKGSIETTQAVEVYFNFVGKYIPPAFQDVELTLEEQETLRKKEELKDRRHQAYLRCKTSGWQWQYEERTKAAKKTKIDTKKAAIRQEDIERACFPMLSICPAKNPGKRLCKSGLLFEKKEKRYENRIGVCEMGDYYFPDLTLEPPPNRSLGKYDLCGCGI